MPTRFFEDQPYMVVLASALLTWFSTHPSIRIFAGLLFLVSFAWLYFGLGRRVEVRLFTLFSLTLVMVFAISPILHLLAFIPLLLAAIWMGMRRSTPSRAYHPPVATVEGGGTKRGLTAPEGAVLMEKPVNRVLTAVLTALLKKGLLQEIESEPLRLAVAPEFKPGIDLRDPAARAAWRRGAAADQGVLLHPYETPFLELMEGQEPRPVLEINFSVPLKLLIRHVADRTQGYDLAPTRRYYQRLVERARADVRSAGQGEGWEQVLDHHLAWLVLDEEDLSLFRTAWSSYRPPWRRLPPESDGKRYRRASFADWLSGALEATAASFEPHGLRARAPSGETLVLSGTDPLTDSFRQAVAAGR
jgi:hypothetical protein